MRKISESFFLVVTEAADSIDFSASRFSKVRLKPFFTFYKIFGIFIQPPLYGEAGNAKLEFLILEICIEGSNSSLFSLFLLFNIFKEKQNELYIRCSRFSKQSPFCLSFSLFRNVNGASDQCILDAVPDKASLQTICVLTFFLSCFSYPPFSPFSRSLSLIYDIHLMLVHTSGELHKKLQFPLCGWPHSVVGCNSHIPQTVGAIALHCSIQAHSNEPAHFYRF